MLKRKSYNKAFVGLIVLLYSVAFCMNVCAEEDNLLAAISGLSGETIQKYWAEDFDGDGNKEVFAAVGEDEMGISLWFSSSVEVKKLPVFGSVYSSDYNYPEGICYINSDQKLFVIESGAFGSGSTSNCFYVEDGYVKTVENAGEGLRQGKGTQFYIHPGAFDAVGFNGDDFTSGHTYKRYYLEWTGSGFREYTGSEISQTELQSYAGASDILSTAQSEGYSIGRIFKRDNGIINVNLLMETDSKTEYENLTMEIDGNTVNLVIVNHGGTNWIDKYSFHGIYESSCYD